MIYPYLCKSCGNDFNVIKSVKDIDNQELCKCGGEAVRYISRTHFYGAKVEDAEYNPAFGCIVKSAKHRKDLAKRLNVEEVGNEPVEKIHEHYEKQLEKDLAASWDKV